MVSEEIVTYEFKEGLPIEFEIVDIPELFKVHKNNMARPHRTGFYHIYWVRENGACHVVDFSQIKLPENTLLFLNKDTVQTFDAKKPLPAKAILFTQAFFGTTAGDFKFLKDSALFNDLFTLSTVNISDADLETFKMLFFMMEREASKSQDEHQARILQSLLYSFLLHAERVKQTESFSDMKKSADRDYLLLFRDLLEVHFKTNKQVKFYSSELHVTERRLNQAASKTLGKTVKQAIDERVILEAKRLLAHTSNSIKKIAFMLGFEEPTNFIKYFKKHTSCTPVEFRENQHIGLT
jgi:AraC family transcriptional activator of pobA